MRDERWEMRDERWEMRDGFLRADTLEADTWESLFYFLTRVLAQRAQWRGDRGRDRVVAQWRADGLQLTACSPQFFRNAEFLELTPWKLTPGNRTPSAPRYPELRVSDWLSVSMSRLLPKGVSARSFYGRWVYSPRKCRQCRQCLFFKALPEIR